jgi:hypothetical protein
VVFAAVSHEMNGIGGKYLEDMKMVSSSRYSYRREEQQQLWKQTIDCIRPWIDIFITQTKTAQKRIHPQDSYDIFVN